MAKFNNYFENFSATKIVSLHHSVFFAVPVHAVGGVIFPLFPVFGSEMATEKKAIYNQTPDGGINKSINP